MATPIRFYKKFSPENKIQLADGRYMEAFKVAFPGDVVGYFATNNPSLQGYFEQLMSEGRYAISEISESEFHRDYVAKKAQPQRPAWREELGRSSAGLSLPQEPATRLAEEGRLSVVGVSGCDQPGKPAGMSVAMTDANTLGAAAQPVQNASIAQALSEQSQRPVPAAGGRSKGARVAKTVGGATVE